VSDASRNDAVREWLSRNPVPQDHRCHQSEPIVVRASACSQVGQTHDSGPVEETSSPIAAPNCLTVPAKERSHRPRLFSVFMQIGRARLGSAAFVADRVCDVCRMFFKPRL